MNYTMTILKQWKFLILGHSKGQKKTFEFWISRHILNLLRRQNVFVQLPPKQTILRALQLLQFLQHCIAVNYQKKIWLKHILANYLRSRLEEVIFWTFYSTKHFFLPELDTGTAEVPGANFSNSIIQLVRDDLADIVMFVLLNTLRTYIRLTRGRGYFTFVWPIAKEILKLSYRWSSLTFHFNLDNPAQSSWSSHL